MPFWHAQGKKKKREEENTSRAGLEPATFELEVQCANPLRHRDTWSGVATTSILIVSLCLTFATWGTAHVNEPTAHAQLKGQCMRFAVGSWGSWDSGECMVFVYSSVAIGPHDNIYH